MNTNRLLAIDTETTGVNFWAGDRPFGVSFAFGNGRKLWYEFDVNPRTRQPIYTRDKVHEIRKLVTDPKWIKIFHNRKFDCRAIKFAFDFEVAGEIHDTYFMWSVLFPNLPSKELKPIADQFLDMHSDDEKSLLKGVNKCRRWAKKNRPSWMLGEVPKTDMWLPRACWKSSPENFEGFNKLCRRYGVRDAVRALKLFILGMTGLHKEGLYQTYQEEQDLCPVIERAEERGIYLDHVENARLTKEYKSLAKQNWQTLQRMAWKDFNMNSKDQLATLLFKRRKIPFTYITKAVSKSWPRGIPGVNDETLKPHFGRDPVVTAIINKRAYDKAVGTYFENFEARKTRDDYSNGYCIHPSFKQCEAITGRLSCVDPNIQNLSDPSVSRALVKVGVRRAFGPRPGHVWYCADYNQIEVLIVATDSNDERLLHDIASGSDIHVTMTNRIFGGKNNPLAIRAGIAALNLTGKTFDYLKHLDDKQRKAIESAWSLVDLSPQKIITLDRAKRERVAAAWCAKHGWDIVKAESSVLIKVTKTRCKQVTFGKIYGGGDTELARQAGCSVDEMKETREVYDQAYPRLKEFMYEAISDARRTGYCFTLYGSRIPVDPNFAYRAVNYRTQGTAARMLKRGIVRCQRYLDRIRRPIWFLMTIHDENIFEAKKPVGYGPIKELARIMADGEGLFPVPIRVNIKRVTHRWDNPEDVTWAA